MSLHKSPNWAEHPDLVAFYKQHRNRPEDIYPSERRFLPWLAKQATRVLDVGCAAGGFKNIWCHYQPDITYIGVDVSASLISVARELYPDAEFHQGDCTASLPFPNQYATVVSALGWLHWERQYRKAIWELWRLTERYLFFDVRLVAEPDQTVSGEQQLAFTGSWDGETTTPYVTIAWPTFAEVLLDLQSIALFGYGYWGKPAETVMGVDQQVCFATFVLEKAPVGGNPGLPSACIDMPLSWPAVFTEQVNMFPAEKLDTLVPQM